MNDSNITTDKTIFTLYKKNTIYLERFIYRYFPHTVQYKVQSCQSANWNDISFGQLRSTKDKTEIILKQERPLAYLCATLKGCSRWLVNVTDTGAANQHYCHLTTNVCFSTDMKYGLEMTTRGEFNILNSRHVDINAKNYVKFNSV